MALLVRYIHGPISARVKDTPIERVKLNRVFSFGWGRSSRFLLPKGRDVSEQSAVIKKIKDAAEEKLVLEARQEKILLRHPGEQYFDELENAQQVPLEHGQLIKIGPHLFDVVDTRFAKPGDHIVHTVYANNVHIQEVRTPEGSAFTHDWTPKTFSRWTPREKHPDLEDPKSWFPPSKLVIHTIL